MYHSFTDKIIISSKIYLVSNINLCLCIKKFFAYIFFLIQCDEAEIKQLK